MVKFHPPHASQMVTIAAIGDRGDLLKKPLSVLCATRSHNNQNFASKCEMLNIAEIKPQAESDKVSPMVDTAGGTELIG